MCDNNNMTHNLIQMHVPIIHVPVRIGGSDSKLAIQRLFYVPHMHSKKRGKNKQNSKPLMSFMIYYKKFTKKKSMKHTRSLLVMKWGLMGMELIQRKLWREKVRIR